MLLPHVYFNPFFISELFGYYLEIQMFNKTLFKLGNEASGKAMQS